MINSKSMKNINSNFEIKKIQINNYNNVKM